MSYVYGTVTIKTFHQTSTAQGLIAQLPAAAKSTHVSKDSVWTRVTRKTVTLVSMSGVTQTEAAEIVSGWRLLNTPLYDALIRDELLLIEFRPEPMRWNTDSCIFCR